MPMRPQWATDTTGRIVLNDITASGLTYTHATSAEVLEELLAGCRTQGQPVCANFSHEYESVTVSDCPVCGAPQHPGESLFFSVLLQSCSAWDVLRALSHHLYVFLVSEYTTCDSPAVRCHVCAVPPSRSGDAIVYYWLCVSVLCRRCVGCTCMLQPFAFNQSSLGDACRCEAGMRRRRLLCHIFQCPVQELLCESAAGGSCRLSGLLVHRHCRMF